ncbi:DVU_1551 family NTP transferase [Uliginosibacterium gangwonense]|uniref:DVU_1551 family NTP transferase n=1 Tax=Uliginosibacterium gangwonense TaxID=392736 RepID=UPI00037DDD69|nr:NTP transferase domain-containing protein [Uliginosibacterium gangwonense]
MSKFAALILAAGFSSRMGSFKPLLKMGDKMAIEWTVETFRGAGITDIRVVTGHMAELLEAQMHRQKIQTVRNPDYAKGMYTSVCAGLRALPGDIDACFLLPVDIPLVRTSTITALTQHYENSSTAVTYPVFRKQRGHPPLIRRDLFAAILKGNGEGGLCALLHHYQAAEFAVADEAILLDMDTPADHVMLSERSRIKHPNIAECEALLELHGISEAVYRHSHAVARVAVALCRHLGNIDAELILAASLLHDIAKGQSKHAVIGAELLDGLGYPKVADIIRVHMDLEYTGSNLDESAIVFFADKLISEDCLVSLEHRFSPAFERFADQPEALAGAQRKYRSACKIRDAVESATGLSIAQILATCGVQA